MQERPVCGYCEKPESGITFIGGKIACGSCVCKWQKRKMESERKLLEED